MRDRRVAERAHDVQQGIGISIRDDIDERFRVAAPRRHVGKFDGSRHALLRLKQRGQQVEAHVRHTRNSDVGLGFSVCTRRLVDAGEQFEDGGLARSGESCKAGS